MELYNGTSFKYDLHLANYFTVSPGQSSWGPRVIKDYELIYIVEGTGRYHDDTGELTVGSQEILLIPPDRRHTFSCSLQDTPSVISCIHFGVTPPARNGPQVVNASRDSELSRLFRKCAYEFDRKEPWCRDILQTALAEIMVRLRRLVHTRSPAPEPLKLKLARIYIRERYRQPVSRGEIARHLSITPEHLNFLFKKHLSQTPLGYLREVRLRQAKVLLHRPGLNVSEVAAAVGYQDPLYFSRVFKQREGVSPKKYSYLL